MLHHGNEEEEKRGKRRVPSAVERWLSCVSYRSLRHLKRNSDFPARPGFVVVRRWWGRGGQLLPGAIMRAHERCLTCTSALRFVLMPALIMSPATGDMNIMGESENQHPMSRMAGFLWPRVASCMQAMARVFFETS